MAFGTFAVGLLLWAAGAFPIAVDRDLYPGPVKFALLCGALALQLSAPRRPGAAFAAMAALLAWDALLGPSLPLWIAMSDIIYIAVVHGGDHLRTTVTVVSTVTTAGLSAAAALAFSPHVGILVGLVGLALLMAPLGYAQAVLASRRAARAEIAAAEGARTAALAEERRRVARELHDTVAGHVAAIAVLSEAARSADDPQPTVASIRANSLRALDEMRNMIDLLSADGDETATARWDSLAPLVTAAQTVGSEVTVDPVPDGLPRDAEAVATRIAGEALANATRHAPGLPVRVSLDLGRDLAVTVRNPLPCDGTRWQEGNGMRNMVIRAQAVGGHATVGPEGADWLVTAEIPVRRP